VLGSVEALMAPDSPAHGVVLVKPQFEVGPQGLGRNGVVRDARLRQQALDQVVATAREVGFVAVEWAPSPVTGGDGNAEWLLRLHRPH
jgi:23S rRNA (cytidine1920-2'-O)/16S rRNA (cytidine1409-2'-O)-methyltransferase